MSKLGWGRALTLAERAARLSGGPPDRPTPAVITERGRKRLTRWRSQSSFRSDGLFTRRLAQTGLSEPDLLALLSREDSAAQEPTGVVPGWAAELIGALAGSGGSGPGVQVESQDPSFTLLVALADPLIRRAAQRLRDGIGSLRVAPGAVLPETAVLERMFVALLPGRLLPLGLRTLVLELQVARLQGLLNGETSDARYQSFVARLQEPPIRRALFAEYPVLGRLIATALDQWVTCSLEFLRRWRRDWSILRCSFGEGADPGPLAGVEESAGDQHRAGRRVWIARFQSGLKVVYKPRSLAVDQRFQEVLGWLNGQGVSAPYRLLRVLDRGDYGWEEFVPAQACSSQQEVRRFYERVGGYLALLYALAATDFHQENLRAAGEHPVLLDLEALFHGPGVVQTASEANDLAGRSFLESVLGSGLLPVPVWSERDGTAFDLSGLGAEAGQRLQTRLPGWEGVGTDRMRFEPRTTVIESSEHRPSLGGKDANPLDYLDAIEGGFEAVYRLLAIHRTELLEPQGVLSRFAEDEVRVVLRDTTSYVVLLQEGTHPDVLRDALERDRLFDRLWGEVSERPSMALLVASELEDLWRGDVPLFTSRPGSRDVWDSVGRRFPHVLSESGVECARRRLGELGEHDLKRQLWFLRASLTTLASRQRQPVSALPSRAPRPGPVAGPDQFLDASLAVGDRLVDTAFHGAGDVCWVGLSLLREKQWVLVPVGLDLYDGVPGIGLFLGFLGAISGVERYTHVARASLDTMRRRLRPDRQAKGVSELGGFAGWGGVFYTFAQLGILWNEPALLEEAKSLAEVVPSRLERDLDLDVVAGAAGCIAGLLCLQACSPSARVRQIAIQCGDHLLSQAKPTSRGHGWNTRFPSRGPLAGFSHGAAGISWTLLELAAHSGESRFKKAALGGIEYERSLFSPETGNWPDLQLPEPALEGGDAIPGDFRVAWCHGAPGIGLARLLCRRHLDDPLLDAEIQTALDTTRAHGFGSNHSLCHGDLGNLELFVAAAEAFPGSARRDEVQQLASAILNTIKRDGWRCGNPLAVESPGLMTGLAGIGYGLLRCAARERVPSVLAFAPPIQPSPAGAKSPEAAFPAQLA